MVTALKTQSAFDSRPDHPFGGSLELTLPILPPSTNNLYANIPGKGRVRSREYSKWIAQMGLLLNAQCKGRISGRVDLKFVFGTGNGARDVSNALKPCEDLLVSVGIIKDDRAAYVRSITGTWADIEGVRIEIWPTQPHVAKQGRQV